MKTDSSILRVDLLILSNLGRSEGGRETWCYTVLPRWLKRNPNIHLRLHMLASDGKDDSRPIIAKAFAESSDRFELVRHVAGPTRRPLFYSMLPRVRAFYARPDVKAPDVSIAMGVMEMLMQLAAPKLKNAPRIVWLRSIFWDEKSKKLPGFLHPPVRRFTARLLGGSDLLLANGDDIAEHYARYDLPVQVIKNGVELERWEMPPPSFEGPIRVAYIGRLSDAKGSLEFLSMAERIAEGPYGSHFEFHVWGFGNHEPQVVEMADRGIVKFYGRIENTDIPEKLRTMDVCVAFTRSSADSGGGGTSNALMEQLAAGRLMLAWGNRYYLQYLHEGNALLVPQDDAEAAAEALIAIHQDRAHARALAAEGNRTIQPYSVENQLPLFEAAVRSVV
ncbi:glycosyltransferase [Sphingomonas colocasiae]|uniref:Glycosyltransferase n=1 Tax=Sphingomonas colocasiae TaxID=1848973 RepID=A0ABS7PSF3_9SPHN|nr:glycosyltransferase [Sphingomonas colocasiae]MBY8823605.1 glycosyltransferase [Sphingomonas colocasiae]